MPFYILLILGGLSAFGPLAIDMYLPAFPAIGAALAADPEQVQLSLSVYFLGLASGQLVYGPLADLYGGRCCSVSACFASPRWRVRSPRLWNGCLPRVSLRRWVAVRAWWSTGQWCAICVRQLMQPRRFPS